MKILSVYKETGADGPGLRCSIYVAGCDRKCPNCHNPSSWNFEQGKELDRKLIEEIISIIQSNPLLNGITISGGDPLHEKNADGTLHLLKRLSILDKQVMVYTGAVFEDLLTDPDNLTQKKCLKYIDLLVDGPYIDTLKEYNSFKGSCNQRYIKVKEYLVCGNRPLAEFVLPFV